MSQTILVVGNPVDGFIFVGPFLGKKNSPEEEASTFAEENPGGDWWIAELVSKKEYIAQ